MSVARTSRSTAPDASRRRTRAGSPRALSLRHRVAFLLVACAALSLGAMPADSAAGTGTAPTAKVHFACSKPNSAKIPCYFSTPSHNIRCIWTPKSQDVTCVRVSNRRGFVLHPTGKAKAIKVNLMHPGELLPMSQMIVFPQKLSCDDTKTSITCNQDEGAGFFTIGPNGSKSH
jgi:hypothetical protein